METRLPQTHRDLAAFLPPEYWDKPAQPHPASGVFPMPFVRRKVVLRETIKVYYEVLPGPPKAHVWKAWSLAGEVIER